MPPQESRGPLRGFQGPLSRPQGLHPYLSPRGPIAFAHRGGAGDAPENTLAAFEVAWELGYRYFETDVHLTRDGVLVAFHDERLDRVSDGRGAIAELNIADVLAADAGYTFSPDGGRTFPFRGRGIRVPLMSEILETWPAARINVDPKADACVEPLAALLHKHDAWERTCVGSFSDRRLTRLRRLACGRACTSMGPRAVGTVTVASLTGRMPSLGANCIQVPISQGRVPIVTARFVTAAHRAGLRVHVWTVNDAAQARELLELGVDGIMTDRLRVLRDVFSERGLALDGAG